MPALRLSPLVHTETLTRSDKHFTTGDTFFSLILYFRVFGIHTHCRFDRFKLSKPLQIAAVDFLSQWLGMSSKSPNIHSATIRPLYWIIAHLFISGEYFVFLFWLPLLFMVAFEWNAKKRSRKGEREESETIERAAVSKELWLTNRLQSHK